MIIQIEDNMSVDIINMMEKAWKDNDGYVCYDRNQAGWIRFFMNAMANRHDPKWLCIADVDEDANLNGFMIASAFQNHYTQEWVFNVDDCIVDYEKKNNIHTVIRLFDHMIDHVREHGGKHWRADSAREYDASLRYAQFLNKRYNATISHSVRGQV